MLAPVFFVPYRYLFSLSLCCKGFVLRSDYQVASYETFFSEWEGLLHQSLAAGLVFSDTYLACKLLVALSPQLDVQPVLTILQNSGGGGLEAGSLQDGGQGSEAGGLFSLVKHHLGQYLLGYSPVQCHSRRLMVIFVLSFDASVEGLEGSKWFCRARIHFKSQYNRIH